VAVFPEILAGDRLTDDLMTSMLAQHVVKATSETVTSSTTFQNDDELFLPGVANATYLVDVCLLHSSGTTGKFKCQFTGPAGAAFAWGVIGVQNAQTSSTSAEIVSMPSRTITDSQEAGGTNLGGTTMFIKGVFTTSSTAGNLQLQFAQIVSNAAATQVRAGSYMTMRRIA